MQAQHVFCLQGAQAIADVILGKVSPSARLPMSFYYSNYTRQARMTNYYMVHYLGRSNSPADSKRMTD